MNLQGAKTKMGGIVSRGSAVSRHSCHSGAAEALDKELAGCQFCDPRLGRRFRKLVGKLATKLGQTIPLACQDWRNTKAAYRFLSNGWVNEMAILDGHFQATRERFTATGGPISPAARCDGIQLFLRRPLVLSGTPRREERLLLSDLFQFL